MKQLPEHGFCFICGSDNPKGLGVRWYAQPDNSIYTKIELTKTEQGPPGHAHGGALAALLDEVMGTAAWYAGHMVLAANLNVDFRHPVPLGVPLVVTGVVVDINGRKLSTRGEISLPDGTKATVGKGLFIEASDLFTQEDGSSGFLKMLPKKP